MGRPRSRWLEDTAKDYVRCRLKDGDRRQSGQRKMGICDKGGRGVQRAIAKG
jgi:hypothetical protein